MANKSPTFETYRQRGTMPRYETPETINRLSAAKRGYDKSWQYIRHWFLKTNPLCADCHNEKKLVPASEVHHIKAIKYGGTNALENLMALCKQHHQRRTNRHE